MSKHRNVFSVCWAALPTSNQWAGTQDLRGNVTVCGYVQFTGNVRVNAPSNAVLAIENGQFDTNGYSKRPRAAAG